MDAPHSHFFRITDEDALRARAAAERVGADLAYLAEFAIQFATQLADALRPVTEQMARSLAAVTPADVIAAATREYNDRGEERP